MFLPHSDVLAELFGLSGQQFVSEIKKICHAFAFGLPELVKEMAQFEKDVTEAAARKAAELPPGTPVDFDELMDQSIEENGWQQRRAHLGGRVFGLDLSDVEKLTELPRRLVDELSWSPGEEKEFFADGEFRGWSLRVRPVFKRPFIRLNGRSYCFDLYSLLDHLYRVMQRIILRLKPGYADTWRTIQQRQAEDLPFNYLARILPGAKILQHAYYRGTTDAGTTDWCEADGLIYDDHLFVIESRGGAFTSSPPPTDFPAFVASLKNLVLKPATQGRRFVDYDVAGAHLQFRRPVSDAGRRIGEFAPYLHRVWGRIHRRPDGRSGAGIRRQGYALAGKQSVSDRPLKRNKLPRR